MSGLENVLIRELTPTDEAPRHFFLYGDAGYDGSDVIASPIALREPDVPVGSHRAANSARVSIENVFGAKKGTTRLPLDHLTLRTRSASQRFLCLIGLRHMGIYKVQ